MNDSRIPGFFRMNAAARLAVLVERGFVDPADADLLKNAVGGLSLNVADKMVENVVGVFALPFAVAPNFRMNDRDFVVPMVIEEPSVVAAVSGAARLARWGGGFSASSDDPILLGQVQLAEIGDPDDVIARLRASSALLLQHANDLQPRLQSRGGSVRSIEFAKQELSGERHVVTVQVAIDTRDAMGANLVNTVCEGLAPRLEDISGGVARLRILSNLADRSLVRSSVTLPLAALRMDGFAAEEVRDAIILANDIAMVDAYRAATHNKGIMNGVDAVAIATGNDWRSIEAAVHAYASRSDKYRSLTQWSATASGDLRGELELPLKVGIVGGSLQSNPLAAIGLRMVSPESATELAELMCSVGLAQNFAALRALVTSGIQKGHMSLHARSVAAAAGAPAEIFEQVVHRLIESGEVKHWKAAELIAELQDSPDSKQDRQGEAGKCALGTAAGKVILLGEHAVVYGRHALALPIPGAVSARIRPAKSKISLRIPAWNLLQTFDRNDTSLSGAARILQLLLSELRLDDACIDVSVSSRLPPAMGLGASAALAAALARAIDDYYSFGLSDEKINALTFACEKISHGNPSGIDNTLAVFGEPVLFNNTNSALTERLQFRERPPLLVACSNSSGSTKQQVAGVATRHAALPQHYDAIFDEIGALSLAGAAALAAADYAALGGYMNVCHGLLNAIEVSTPELEHMIAVTRQHGAIGAKLTGAGGGGSIVALCPETVAVVAAALNASGFRTFDIG